jgi:hypothetical protein
MSPRTTEALHESGHLAHLLAVHLVRLESVGLSSHRLGASEVLGALN